MSDDFVQMVQDGLVGGMDQDAKTRTRTILDGCKDLDKESCRKIWCFGILETQANVLIDSTKGVAYLNEIKDSCKTGFQQATVQGPMCHEGVRGLLMEINDVVLHADSIHRGTGQIMPIMKKNVYGCILASSPRLMEPMFKVEITVPQNGINGVYETLTTRRGEVINEEKKAGNPLTIITAYLPVLESFGFTGYLREKTSGMAFPQMIFSHWQMMEGEFYTTDPKGMIIPLEKSFAIKQALEVRKRKGMKDEIPPMADYYDKI